MRALAQQRFAPREAAQAEALRRAKAQCEAAAQAFGRLVTEKLPPVKEDRREQALQTLKSGG